jgi:predicted Zn-dependent protease
MASPECTRAIMSWLAGIAAATALCFGLGCSGPGTMVSFSHGRGERLTQLLSFETRLQQSAIARRSTPYREPFLEQYLERMVDGLMREEAAPGVLPRVVLISDTGQNAYSFPDGAIYIHTGLLAQIESEAQLALLLAHELAHITRRHALRALAAIPAEAAETVFDRALSDSLSWFHELTRPKEVSGPSQEPAQELANLRRTLEQEADAVGLDMVVKANYDPYEALEIFEHLKEDNGDRSGPARAAALLQALDPSAPPAGRRTDHAAFGRHLQHLLLEQGRLELRHGRSEKALRCARRLLRVSPAQARGHFLMGEILRQRNKAEDGLQALAHYHQALAADPLLPEPHKAIGLIHLEQGRALLARGFFEKALALAPQAPDSDYIRSYLTQCIITIEGENP